MNILANVIVYAGTAVAWLVMFLSLVYGLLIVFAIFISPIVEIIQSYRTRK